MAYVFFQLGANQDLSKKEIELTFKEKSQVYSGFSFMNIPSQKVKKIFPNLGGCIRFGLILGEGKTFKEIEKSIIEHHTKNLKEGVKKRIGLCFSNKKDWKKYGIDLHKNLKNISKENDISLRIVNRDSMNLDTFAVRKEKLLIEKNFEYVFIPIPTGWAWGITKEVQNAKEFLTRDLKKPIRDMKIGMIPPKLARIMINSSRGESGNLPEKIYDPFCGTGTFLLEGLSLGIKVSGSDINLEMVNATKKNTLWFYNKDLKLKDLEPLFIRDIFKKNATHDFYPDQKKKISHSSVVSEGFLGKIFYSPINESQYISQKEILLPLYRQFIFKISKENIDKIVFAFPFWKGKTNNYSFVNEILKFSRNLKLEEFSSSVQYIKENQVVGREIVFLKKIKL
jgi:tRNA G10  N-methylase Trm11